MSFLTNNFRVLDKQYQLAICPRCREVHNILIIECYNDLLLVWDTFIFCLKKDFIDAPFVIEHSRITEIEKMKYNPKGQPVHSMQFLDYTTLAEYGISKKLIKIGEN